MKIFIAKTYCEDDACENNIIAFDNYENAKKWINDNACDYESYLKWDIEELEYKQA